MPEIEKVINGLECCCQHIIGKGCGNCPYNDFETDTDPSECFSELAYDALELMKEYKAIKETISDEIHKTAKMFRRTAGDNKIPLKW